MALPDSVVFNTSRADDGEPAAKRGTPPLTDRSEGDEETVLQVTTSIKSGSEHQLAQTIGSGTHIAGKVVDVMLIRNTSFNIGNAIRISDSILRNSKQNLGWACGHNIAPILLATLVLVQFVLAAGARVFSSVAVLMSRLLFRQSPLAPPTNCSASANEIDTPLHHHSLIILQTYQ
jgi:cation transport ATPase